MIKIAKDKVQFCCDVCSKQSLVVYDKSFNDSCKMAERIGWVCAEEAGGRTKRVDICPVCYENSRKAEPIEKVPEEDKIGKDK